MTVGDGASFNVVDDDALRAQQLDSLNGKILHITKDGLGLSSNPYWNGDATANRSKVYARGVRNSFRMTVRPGTSTPVAGEVGWGAFDEINVVTSSANLGWPCYEGVGKQGGYESKPICQSLYANASEVKPPLIEIPHGGLSAAVVGGEFYTGTLYPAEYRGSYFYGDYAANTMSRAALDSSNNLVGSPISFATEADGPVEIRNGPDENLYYLSISTGELRRVRYRSSPDSLPPTIVSLDPENNAKTVPPDAVVSATFSEEIDPASINDTTFTIVRMSTGTKAPATVTYDAKSRAAVVTPSSQFAAGESYQARLLGGVGGVRDLAGNPLASNVTWTFTVVALPPPGVTQVSDLQWTYMTNGWGPVEKNRSNGETGSCRRPATCNWIVHLCEGSWYPCGIARFATTSPACAPYSKLTLAWMRKWVRMVR